MSEQLNALMDAAVEGVKVQPYVTVTIHAHPASIRLVGFWTGFSLNKEVPWEPFLREREPSKYLFNLIRSMRDQLIHEDKQADRE